MNSSHHAVLCRATLVQDFVLSSGYEDCDIYNIYHDHLGIADTRSLVKKAQVKPPDKPRQCLVVRTNFITHEAQNALLKILEEPPQSTCFVFVLQPDFILLSTLNSRFEVSALAKVAKVDQEVFVEFLAANYMERLAAIDKSSKKKDEVWQRAIKTGLINQVATGQLKSQLAQLEYIARWLLTRGASNKMLLEHLALLLPIRAGQNKVLN